MGFWGSLAKLGAGVAAPFTGGASLAAIPAIDAFGRAAGGASQAQASNRGTKAELMLDQKSQMEEQLLRREMEARSARSAAYRDAVVGAHGSNFQASARPGSVSTPSYVQPNEGAKLAAGELFRQGNRRLLQPDLVDPKGMAPYQDLMSNPDFMKTLKPGIWEKLLGIAGVAAPALGMLGGRDEVAK